MGSLSHEPPRDHKAVRWLLRDHTRPFATPIPLQADERAPAASLALERLQNQLDAHGVRSVPWTPGSAGWHIEAMARAGDKAAVHEVLRDMKRRDARPTRREWAAAVAVADTSDMDMVRLLARLSPADPQRRVRPPKRTPAKRWRWESATMLLLRQLGHHDAADDSVADLAACLDGEVLRGEWRVRRGRGRAARPRTAPCTTHESLPCRVSVRESTLIAHRPLYTLQAVATCPGCWRSATTPSQWAAPCRSRWEVRLIAW